MNLGLGLGLGVGLGIGSLGEGLGIAVGDGIGVGLPLGVGDGLGDGVCIGIVIGLSAGVAVGFATSVPVAAGCRLRRLRAILLPGINEHLCIAPATGERVNLLPLLRARIETIIGAAAGSVALT